MEITQSEVIRYLGDGGIERVRWDELVKVSVMTTDEGPFVEDVFFVLEGRQGNGCVIAQSADQDGTLLRRLQDLPGFDNKVLIQSMSSVEHAWFVCWEASPLNPSVKPPAQ